MLKLENNILVAYAQDFVSFLTERTNTAEIKKIILFGSAARGEASEESDIDLFIDVVGNKKSTELHIKKTLEEFLKSKRYNNYWLLKGIKNEIKPITGKLDDWKELKSSIISNGIVLYGKFEETPTKTIHKTFFYWENTKPESKRVLLSKRLFGYNKGKKNYKGLIHKYEGERIGKGIIAVPSVSAKVFLELFRDMKVTVKTKKVLEYS